MGMTLPDPPHFEDSFIASCRAQHDLRPILFEYYKYVGILASYYAGILHDSPAVAGVGLREYTILVGMLQRCARLILSNLNLGQKGKNRETIAIIDRSIVETAVKLSWLCVDDAADRFDRYVADGFKGDIELRNEITSNVSKRGYTLVIEKRMLGSIAKRILNSGLTETQILSAKKLPDVATLIEKVFPGRINYVVQFKLASHAVHGSWNDIMANYLEMIDGKLVPRTESRELHENQYLNIATMVVEAMAHFSKFCFEKGEIADNLAQIPRNLLAEIQEIYKDDIDADFARA